MGLGWAASAKDSQEKIQGLKNKLNWISRKDNRIVISENDTEIYIENFLIDNTFQNLGIGKEVMKSIIQKSSLENKSIRLQVFKIDTKAQKFYRNFGFERTSENEFNFEMKSCF